MEYKIDHNKLRELTYDTSQNGRYSDLIQLCVERYLGLRISSGMREEPPIDKIEDFLIDAKVLAEITE